MIQKSQGFLLRLVKKCKIEYSFKQFFNRTKTGKNYEQIINGFQKKESFAINVNA